MPNQTRCDRCNFEIVTWRFEEHHAKCNGQGPHRKRPKTNGICKYCSEKCKPNSLGAHVVSCKLNPDRESWTKKIADSRKGTHLSEDQKQKLSETVRKKVREGTWHLSFSRSRTHEYKGIKFHGMWEVRYAMYLDEQCIPWRRPNEKFAYSFEGRNSCYTPDFYLIDEGTYIEIKGYKTPKDEAKWSQFPLKLKILRGIDLIELGILQESEIKKQV